MLTYRDPHGNRLPASALETWLDLRALGWGLTQTPPLAFDELRRLFGKGRSTVLAHLVVLRRLFGTRWKIESDHLVVYFDDTGDDPAGVSAAASPAGEITGASEPPDRVQESGLVQKAGPEIGTGAREPRQNKASPESRTLDCPPSKNLNTDSFNSKREESRNLDQKSGLGAGRRSRYPAIEALRAVAGRYPDIGLYDTLLKVLGDHPDTEKLRGCRREWLERGHNPNSWKWATEWYVTGIPPQGPQGRPAGGLSAPASPRLRFTPEQEAAIRADLAEKARQGAKHGKPS